MQKRYQSVGENRIAHFDVGSGLPILFLHGFPTASHLWQKVIDVLQKDFRCIAPDLMGLGDTEVGAGADLSMQAQAAMVISLMDALGIKCATVVAHDQGGAVAQIIAVNHPERVSKLILVDVVCYDNWPVKGVKMMQLIARMPGGGMILGSTKLRAIANALGGGFPKFYNPSIATDDIKNEYERTITSTPERIERFKRFLLALDNRCTREIAPALKTLNVPTLIVWADHDAFLDLKWAWRLAADIPKAQGPAIIRNTGHFIPWERPKELAHIVGRFIKKQDTF